MACCEYFDLGETGVGKNVATKIHRHSKKKDGPFKEINLADAAPDLLKLFGHVKGALIMQYVIKSP